MKNFKNVFAFLLVGVLFTAFLMNCEEEQTGQNVQVQQEVQFGITELASSDLKNTIKSGPSDEPDVPYNCVDSVAAYATIEISDGETTTTYEPDVFKVNGQLYTQSIRFDVPEGQDSASYTVESFVLRAEGGTPLMAIPMEESDFAGYVEKTVDFTFEVFPFEKTEVDVEVLCYSPQNYDLFGYNWFAIDELVIREINFFGDFCTKFFEDYVGSAYEDVPNGLQIDMPAIFKVEVSGVRGEGEDTVAVPLAQTEFTNSGGPYNEPVKVRYPDKLDEIDVITLELSILVKVGSGFEYVHFKTFTVTDDGNLMDGSDPILPGDDGVIDFVLGNCNLQDADVELAPYMNLPESITATITTHHENGYWNIEITEMEPGEEGYDFSTGVYPGWCADAATTIRPIEHTFDVYSSLYPGTWPEDCDVFIDEAVINKINQAYNYIKNYDLEPDFRTLQNLIWWIRGQENEDPYYDAPAYDPQELLDEITGIEDSTPSDLDGDYMPLPGGWAAVLFFKDCESQLIFIQVDP